MGTGGASLSLLVANCPPVHSRQRDATNELLQEDQPLSALAEEGQREAQPQRFGSADQTAERLWRVAMDAR